MTEEGPPASGGRPRRASSPDGSAPLQDASLRRVGDGASTDEAAGSDEATGAARGASDGSGAGADDGASAGCAAGEARPARPDGVRTPQRRSDDSPGTSDASGEPPGPSGSSGDRAVRASGACDADAGPTGDVAALVEELEAAGVREAALPDDANRLDRATELLAAIRTGDVETVRAVAGGTDDADDGTR